MVTSILGLCIIILLVALGISLFVPGLIGTFSGIVVSVLAAAGALFLAGFIIVVVFSGVGLLVAGIIGLVGVILLALALPILAPLFIVIVPIVILLKLLK
jgi:hypothetical protein